MVISSVDTSGVSACSGSPPDALAEHTRSGDIRRSAPERLVSTESRHQLQSALGNAYRLERELARGSVLVDAAVSDAPGFAALAASGASRAR